MTCSYYSLYETFWFQQRFGFMTIKYLGYLFLEKNVTCLFFWSCCSLFLKCLFFSLVVSLSTISSIQATLESPILASTTLAQYYAWWSMACSFGTVQDSMSIHNASDEVSSLLVWTLLGHGIYSMVDLSPPPPPHPCQDLSPHLPFVLHDPNGMTGE